MNNLISIFICTYNEELLLPFTISFYRSRFPGCDITIVDNCSTDSTVDIAKRKACAVIQSFTDNKMRDEALRIIKNTVWQTAVTPWVIICDCDMWLDINEHELNDEDKIGSTLIQMDWYEMVGPKSGIEVPLTNGVRYPCKQIICFKGAEILSMNFDYGAHEALPLGNIKFSAYTYHMYHQKWISLEYIKHRYARFRARYTKRERKKGLSVHYFFSWFKTKRMWKNLHKKAIRLNIK